MRPLVQRVHLLFLCVLIPWAVPTAAAQDATASVDAAPANCPSAIARQERLASAAEQKRMHRAARIVTKETLAQAEALAAKWWEEQGVAFLRDSARRGGDHIERSVKEYAPRIGEIPQATCRALASHDLAQCQALPDGEREGCQAWIALHAATGEGGDCAQAPEVLRGACALIRSPGSACPSEGPSAKPCQRVQEARENLAAACKSVEGETACTWAALLSSLGPGAEGCDLVRPGGERRSPRARRTHALCSAVLSGAPLRCPDDTVLVQVDDVATWIESRVISGRQGLRLVTNLQVDRPAVCAVQVTLEAEAEGAEVPAETLTWMASPGSRVSVPDWRELKRQGSPWAIRPVASATCVPRVRWGGP